MRDNVRPAVVGRDPPLAGEGLMDRIDAMKVFVVALDEGSLAGAGRKLGRSPAARLLFWRRMSAPSCCTGPRDRSS
jgi:hypothetical protein